MNKIKVSEATNIQLNWLVARALGKNPSLFIFKQVGQLAPEHNYTADWSQMGPIIEREEIGTKRRAPCMKGEEWEAVGSITAKGAGYRYAVGPTPLIAAARCYVVSKLGETVEVPEELE